MLKLAPEMGPTKLKTLFGYMKQLLSSAGASVSSFLALSSASRLVLGLIDRQKTLYETSGTFL